jgi:transcriptional regulator with XRE-family HTH domain
MATTQLQAVVGANVRRIRTEHGVTQAQLASHARRVGVGLKLTASKVGDIESGRHKVLFATVLALVLALDNAVGEGRGPSAILRADGSVSRRKRPRVTLADLVTSDGNVSVTDELVVTGEALARVCSGQTWELRGGIDTPDDVAELLDDAPGFERYRMNNYAVADMRKRSTEADHRLASKLGIDADHLLGLAWTLWKRPYSEERDRRAAADQFSRRLTGQLLTTELQAQLWKESH